MKSFFAGLFGTRTTAPRVPKFIQDYEVRRLQKMKRVDYTPPETPAFRTESDVSWFNKHLAEASGFVEFGAGGSTFAAAELGKIFVSIESDADFHTLIRNAIEAKGQFNAEEMTFLQRSIGETRGWGKPYLVGAPSSSRQESFRRFSDFPEDQMASLGSNPLVLVDGRFRLACALKSIIPTLIEANGKIIVDDYRGRKFYHDVENFAEITERSGRMICLGRAKNIDRGNLFDRIAVAELDWR